MHTSYETILLHISNHTQSTCTLSHQFVFSDVLSNFVVMKNSFHTNDMNVASPLHEVSGVLSGLKATKMFCRTGHMSIVSLQCECSCAP